MESTKNFLQIVTASEAKYSIEIGSIKMKIFIVDKEIILFH